MLVRRRPRRILYLDHAVIWGGAEAALARMLDYLDPSEFEPVVGVRSDSPLALRLAKSAVRTYPITAPRLRQTRFELPFRWLHSAWEIAVLARAMDVDLIHSNTLRMHASSALAAAIVRRPLIWTIHDNVGLPGWVARLLSPAPRRVIAVSGWLAQAYARHGLEQKLRVIPNGLDLRAPLAMRSAARAALEIPGGAQVVLFCGRLIPGKAPHLFLRAAEKVEQMRPGAYFVIAGGAESDSYPGYDRELQAAVSSTRAGAHLIFTGFCEDVDPLYAAADVLVYPSTAPEGLPTVLLEGMRYGLPIVASGLGGALEIVSDEQTGLLFPPGDVDAIAAAIESLLVRPAFARDLGAAGRDRLTSRFDVLQQVAAIQLLYREVLEQRLDGGASAN